MSGRAPYFGPSGDCRIAAGEILNVKVTIRESRDGADLDVTGRTFALSIYRGLDEGEIYSTSAVGVGTSAILSADGDTTRGWRDQYQGVPLRIMVVELFDGGFSTLSDGGLNVVAASRSLVPGNNQPTDTGPVVQIVFVEASNQSLFLAIGAPGRPGADAPRKFIDDRHCISAPARGDADSQHYGCSAVANIELRHSYRRVFAVRCLRDCR